MASEPLSRFAGGGPERELRGRPPSPDERPRDCGAERGLYSPPRRVRTASTEYGYDSRRCARELANQVLFCSARRTIALSRRWAAAFVSGGRAFAPSSR